MLPATRASRPYRASELPDYMLEVVDSLRKRGRTLSAIGEDRNRLLLALATGTGKTYIASQIAWR
jgi:superfamily II DNA or RNA helicase